MAIKKSDINQKEFAGQILNNLSDELKAKLSVTEMTEILNAEEETILVNAKKGLKVYLHGFGSWKVTTMAARKGRNPKTGEPIDIEEKNYLRFKTSPEANKALNK